MGAARKYVAILERIKYPVIVLYLAWLIVSAIFGFRFLSRTVNTFDPPTGSPAEVANSHFATYFPHMSPMHSQFVLYVYATDSQSVLRPGVETLTTVLYDACLNYTSDACLGPCLATYEGFYTMIDQGLPWSMANGLVSPGNVSTIISLTASMPAVGPDAGVFTKFMQSVIDANTPDGIGVTINGIPEFVLVAQQSVERDFGVLDGIVMPVAIFILACILRSARLMVLPLISIAHSALGSFMVMYLVTFDLHVVSFAPSLMMSILIAMSIDYSLFLLTRFREELVAGAKYNDAVERMLETAGHTIFVSGVTLAGCFLGMLLFPISMMQTIGIACAVAVSLTLLTNLTLVPAVQLTFKGYFAKCTLPFRCPPAGCDGCCGRKRVEKEDLSINAEQLKSLLSEGGAFNDSDLSESDIESIWYWLGHMTQRLPWNFVVIVVIVGLTIPFDLHAIKYPMTDSMETALPRGLTLTEEYSKMVADFGAGKMYPYMLLIVAPNNVSIISEEFFALGHYTIETLVQMPLNSPDFFTTIFYADNQNVTVADVTLCEYFTEYAQCKALNYARTIYTSDAGEAAWVLVTTSFDPIAPEGEQYYADFLSVLNALSAETGCGYYLAGMPASSWGAIEGTYAHVVLLLSITIGVVLVFVGVAFRAVLVPPRSVISIGITMLWVYGFANLTYQHGVLSWLHIPGLAGAGALNWLPPVMSFSLLVGIGLDYDIFLLVRVKEFRLAGYSTRDATILGLTKTGHIITAAGVIMGIAFSGLLFSSVEAINQLSFYLVFAVLFDTFIVRSVMVPAMVGLLRDANWWPGKVPPVTRGPLPPPRYRCCCRRKRPSKQAEYS